MARGNEVMTEEIRFPYDVLQKAIYDRLKTVSPTAKVYAVVPLANPANPEQAPQLPYIVMGRFSGTPVRSSKDERTWNVSFQVDLWSESTQTAELSQMISTTIGALSRVPLTLESNWNVYSFEVDSCDIGVIVEEFSPVLHGLLTLRFGIEDVS